MKIHPRLLLLVAALALTASPTSASDTLVLEGGEGPGAGKHIVLVSGDEEYRSEESNPMLAKILSQRFGFKCTVLFAIDPETGVLHLTSLEVPEKMDVTPVDAFNPTFFSRVPKEYYQQRKLTPADFGLGKTTSTGLPSDQKK